MRPDPTVVAPRGGVAENLFGLVWREISDVLGEGATAVVLQQAARKAARLHPGLCDLVIGPEGLNYRYRVPDSWQSGADPTSLAELSACLDESYRLLAPLTGTVVLQRLQRLEPLQAYGLAPDRRSPK